MQVYVCQATQPDHSTCSLETQKKVLRLPVLTAGLPGTGRTKVSSEVRKNSTMAPAPRVGGLFGDCDTLNSPGAVFVAPSHTR